MEQLPVMVSVRCLAYNHEPYIRQCLDGFVMQQTNFRFEVVVHDDASTDRTADIIREYANKYPDIIKPIFETENQYSKHDGSIRRILDEACCGKYIAICEGDDYWTDPLKLQKQVDFLEKHEEYSLCCHRYNIYEEDGNVWKPDYVVDLFKQNPHGFTFTSSDNMHHWITKTMTLMYRKSALPDGYSKNYRYCRDVHMNYHLLQNGPGYCMPDDMAVYRQHSGGVFSSLTNREKERINLLVYCEILKNNPDDVDLKCSVKDRLDSYFNRYVKYPIACHDFNSNIWKDLSLVLNEDKLFRRRIDGVCFIMRKCIKTYLNGFNNKQK